MESAMTRATPSNEVVQPIWSLGPINNVVSDKLAVCVAALLASVIISLQYLLSQVAPLRAIHGAANPAFPEPMIWATTLCNRLWTFGLTLVAFGNLAIAFWR